jgi:hypothetical protein
MLLCTLQVFCQVKATAKIEFHFITAHTAVRTALRTICFSSGDIDSLEPLLNTSRIAQLSLFHIPAQRPPECSPRHKHETGSQHDKDARYWPKNPN